jgi:hypothetical protein
MTSAELNHLRRLLAWVRCEIGQAPDEMVAMVQDFIRRGIAVDHEHAQRAMVEAHDRARRVPQYVRDAVKQLGKLTGPGDVVTDARPAIRALNDPSGRTTNE